MLAEKKKRANGWKGETSYSEGWKGHFKSNEERYYLDCTKETI